MRPKTEPLVEEPKKGGKHQKKGGKKPRKPCEAELLRIMFHEDPSTQEFFSSKEPDQKKYDSIPFERNMFDRAQFDKLFNQPKNKSQEEYVRLLQNKCKKVVVANGPAGTGKTMFATEFGVRYFLTDVYEKLIFTRPSVSVDEDLGYLPGTLEDKMAPWVRPIYDILYQFLTPKEVTKLIEDKLIEIAPLGYMRGRTFKNAWIVADEMQNSTISQMKMLLTRMGENSRLVITGDLEQYDSIKGLDTNGLDDFLQRLKGKRSSSISSFEFERKDIQREEVVKEILDIYSGEVIPDYTSSDSPSTPESSSIDDFISL
jgi:phosphate starvation-inducible PhoH-like protein